jgi:hypothetical protein
MSFSKTYNDVLKQYHVEEKLDWKSLLAAGLIAAPGAAKEGPQKEQPAIVQKAVKPSSEEDFLYKIKHIIRQREGSNNFNNVKALHGGTNDPTIGWGHSLRYTNQSRAIFNKVLPNVNFDQVINTNKPSEISLKDAESLLDYDVKSRLSTLKRLYPDFFKYEFNTQQALFDLLYRGDLIFNVTKLLKAGEKDKAIQLLRKNVEKAQPAVKKRVEDSIMKIKNSKDFQKPVAKPVQSR